MRIAGLFAGIGGLELGMHRSGHTTELLCDVLPAARAVLNARFPGVPYRDDITKLRSLPGSVDLLCAGFPCQDLSQAGRTAGLDGERSGLIGEGSVPLLTACSWYSRLAMAVCTWPS